MAATPPGKISRTRALKLLARARELAGRTTDEPEGPPDPALEPFIREVRTKERNFDGRIVLTIEIRFDLSPLPPTLSPSQRSDFGYVLAHDAHRRITTLGIEFYSHWTDMSGRSVFATRAKSRRRVEKMMWAWKHGHVRPASPRP